MKNFFHRLRKHYSSQNGQAVPRPTLDLEAQIEAIRQVETSHHIDLGKQIHCFKHRGLALRLDRDVLGMYRVTVNEGKDRRYSFTILCPQGDYVALHAGYEEITDFLDGERRLTDLPRHERVKGHFYGTS